jgi:glycosyltransferase involved in cell wall biosynthesis
MESVQSKQDAELIQTSSILQGAGVVHIFALGLSARQFLIPHFEALSRHGARQLLVCSEGREAHDAATRGQMRFEPVGIAQSINPFSDLLAVFKLFSLLRRERPALVVAHMSKAAAIGLCAAFFSRVSRRVYYNHGMALFSARGPKRALLWLIERLSCAAATRVFFCSESTRAEALRLGVVSPAKARVVGSGSIAGVDTTLFAPRDSASKDAARKAINIPIDKVSIGFVGRQVPHKGLLTVLEAWRALEDEVRQRAVLVIVGGMPTATIAEAIDSAASEDPSIIVAGTRSDMPNVYAALDVVVLPSWHEGFPYSLLEAQSCGIPAIASAVTGNVDAIIPEVTGLLVPPRDPVALSAAIKRLIDQPGLRRRLGESATERVRQSFSRERVVSNHLAVYAEQVSPISVP